MAERTTTSAHGSLVFFNEQDIVEGKTLIGLDFLWHLELVYSKLITFSVSLTHCHKLGINHSSCLLLSLKKIIQQIILSK